MFGNSKKKLNNNSSRYSTKKAECGLTPKECNGVGMKLNGKMLEKCLECPIYRKKNKE